MDCCLQVLCFKSPEIQLLNVRLHVTAGLSLYTSVFAFGHFSQCLLTLWVLFCSWWSILTPFCKTPHHLKRKMGYVPVAVLLLTVLLFCIISSRVTGCSELITMLVGNILLLYSEAVQCRKLLIPLSQIPRQRRAAGSQASATRWIL